MKEFLKSTLKTTAFILSLEVVKFIWMAIFDEYDTSPIVLVGLATGFVILAIAVAVYFQVLGAEEKKWRNLAILPTLVTVIYLIEWFIIDFASKHVEVESDGFISLWDFGILWYLSIFVMGGFYLTITLIDIIVTGVIKYKNRKVKI
jgi:hypothetical protein